ncbi:ATP-binding SpoIIE family protein phosphatase [Streptomyces antimycoticus]
MPDEAELAAAVIMLSPFGVGFPSERLALDDPVYAATQTFRTGQICTAQSYMQLRKHPDLGTLAPFPYTVTAAPIDVGGQRCGAIAAFWPGAFREPSASLDETFAEIAAKLSSDLREIYPDAEAVQPPAIPEVISTQTAADTTPPRSPLQDQLEVAAPWSAPLIFHLQKLAIGLMSAATTRDAAALATERLMSGFRAQAVAISLLQADRLHVVGAAGCSKEFLRSLDGMPTSAGTPEAEALVTCQQVTFESQEPSHQGGKGLPRGDGRDDHAWAVLPLIAGGRALGVCSVGFGPEQRLIATEQSPLSALAGLLGQAFSRTQLHDAQHALAQKLQQTLLPRMLPQLAGIVTTSRYAPPTGAIELGGDWYDLIKLPTGGIAAVIGDVEGHSTTAAVTMGQLRSAVRGYAMEGHDPITVLDRTNRLLIDLDTELFATCCCVWLDPDTGSATVVSAGHPRPLIRAPQGSYIPVATDLGIPLGIEANPSYGTSIHTLEPGTLLALYSDGLSGRDAELAQSTLEDNLETSGGELETLGDLLIRHAGKNSVQADDAALLLLRYEGPSRSVQENIRRMVIHRHDLQGVQRTRQFLAECLSRWGLDFYTDEAELLGSEVVTNALIHGDSDVDICLRRYPDLLRMEIRDSDSFPAMLVNLGQEKDEAEGGRGMLIVSVLASSWGNSPSGRGKTVWFEMATRS